MNFVPKNLWEQFHKISNIYFLFISVLQMVPSVTTTNGMPTVALPLAFVLCVNAAKDAFEDWRRHQADNKENKETSYIVSSAGVRAGVAADESLNDSDYTSDDSEDSEDADVLLGAALMAQQSAVFGDEFDVRQSETGGAVKPVDSEVEQLVASGVLKTIEWQDISVGDIIVCCNRDRFPADLVILASSDPLGIAFIETASLDGETNLKIRQAHALTVELLGHEHSTAFPKVKSIKGSLECGPPDANLGYFDGALSVTSAGEIKTVPVGTAQVLLRGCRLRNTHWVVGLVIYTGRETKIQMNSSASPHKVSRVERKTNKLTLIIFGLQLILCLVGAIATGILAGSPKYRAIGYLRFWDSSAAAQAFNRFFTWLVLFVNMIPISLIVAMGMVKAAQGVLIGIDNDMYHSATRTFAAARTSDLNEELGQVEHVFTDKTGTLTCNCMEFRKCCIKGVDYGKGLTEIRRNVLKKKGLPVPPDPVKDPSEPVTPNVNFIDSTLRARLANPSDPHFSKLLDFFLHLAINHAVVPEHQNGQLSYSASSPDEGALVYGAMHFGVKFLSRNNQGVLLEIQGHKVQVDILAAVEFTSSRKRSSVLCYFPPNASGKDLPWESDRYVLYCKGADSVIMELLANRGASMEDTNTLSVMERYALDGLRTLCVARRQLGEKEVMSWYEEYEAASLELHDRQKKIEAVAEKIEVELELQGVTGIEDKLQDGVGDTLEALALAGIKTWMLTGDKVETAVNIGIATSLLSTDAIQLIYQLDSLDERASGMSTVAASPPSRPGSASSPVALTVSPSRSELLAEQIQDDIRRLRLHNAARQQGEPDLKQKTFKQRFRRFLYSFFFSTSSLTGSPQSAAKAAVVIDGECLTEVLKPELKEAFIDLCASCNTVICCRVTPFQKGAVVKAVKQLLGTVTLAIGDGANDCNMIQSADVGIGLRGAEGMQAFNVSDYGISQFRFLKVLLLCHGRWCYRRLSRLVLYMIYKNLVVVIPIFHFAFYSLYSGQKIYYEMLYQLYNVILTSIPVIIFGVFDQDVNKQLSLAFPELYRLGQKNFHFNTGVFCRWILNGCAQSFALAILPVLMFSGSKMMWNGLAFNFWFSGHVTMLLVMVVVDVKILMESALLTWMMWLGVLCSMLAWFLSMFLFTSWPSLAPDVIGLMQLMLQTPLWYIAVIGTPIISLSWDYVWKASRYTFLPELYHVIILATRDIDEIHDFPAFLVRSSLRGVEKVGKPLVSEQRSVVNVSPPSLFTATEKRASNNDLSRQNGSVTSRGYAFSEADARAVALLRHSPYNKPVQQTSLGT